MAALSRVSEASSRSLDNTPQEQLFCSDETITNLFWTTISTLTALLQMATLPLYSLFDDGLGNLLGLEVLRHGTCFSNYVGILTHGADPSFGGKENGSTNIAWDLGKKMEESDDLARTKNHFYAFKDSETKESQVFWYAHMHAALSGFNCVAPKNSEEHPLFTAYRIANAVFNALFTPTLRLKFTLEEAREVFHNDPDYGGLAYRTRKKIGTEHFGITGSLRQGLNADLIDRISKNPIKCLAGLCEVITAVALSTFMLQGLLIAAALEATLTITCITAEFIYPCLVDNCCG
ncbi:MAG: hypothetical protein HYX48_01575 [Chlamydiales bacterium]|nr:hypothetical protein [Chlamydiales bacterium]